MAPTSAPPTERRMLATDLDGTLVGNREALAQLKAVLADHRERWLLVYATGRTMTQARQLARDEDLPEPDVWVTEVGASITYADGGPDEAWRAKQAAHWDRDTVERLVSGYALTRQPEEAMGPFKLSFRLDPATASAVFPPLSAELAQAGTPALLVYSSARDLDVIPATAGKGPALEHLMKRFEVPLAQVLTCGDSANDRDMLCLGGPAVAVGNAHLELVGTELPETVLLAKGECAHGILEALTHYQWIEGPAKGDA